MAELKELTFNDKTTAYWFGNFNGEDIKFKQVQLGHKVNEQEANALLAGDKITINAKSKAGKEYQASGHLQKGEYNGHEYYGFVADFMDQYEE